MKKYSKKYIYKIIEQGIDELPNDIKEFINNNPIKIEVVKNVPFTGQIFAERKLLLIAERKDKYTILISLFHEIAHYIDYYKYDTKHIYWTETNEHYKKSFELDKDKIKKLFHFIDKNENMDKDSYFDEVESFACTFSYYILDKMYKKRKYKRHKCYIWKGIKIYKKKCPNLWREIDLFIKNFSYL